MGGFPPHPWTAAVLVVVNMLCNIYAQDGSPCGPNQITISIPEYPKAQDASIDIPGNEWSSYRRLLVNRNNEDLVISITKDPTSTDNPDGLVRVDFFSGLVPQGYYLTLLKELDRDGLTDSADDDRNTLQFKVECSLLGVTGQSYFHILKIQLEDLNDNAPQFTGTPYSIVINELTPPGITVYNSISTTDLDRGNNKLVVYSLRSTTDSQFNGTEIFTLASSFNSYVVLNHQLDYESLVNQVGNSALVTYTMNVTATDQATEYPSQSNWTYLTFTITDGDDLGPVFIYPSCPRSSLKSCISPQYDATVTSGTSGAYLTFLPIPRITADPTQTVVIKARDGDSLNASILCQISYTTPSGYNSNFLVTTERIGTTNEYQCNVFLQTPISRATVSRLEVVIVAVEQTPVNKYQEEAIIFITVTPANQFPPQINANSGIFQGYILENSRAGTEIKTTTALNVPFRLNITDADLSPGDPLPAYDISLSPATTFTVDSYGYIRLMQEPLDYEVIRNYTFELKVGETDTAEKKTSSVTLTIFVLDTNDNSPTVSSSLLTKSQPEGDYSTGAGQFLLTISASDTEDGTNLIYSITDVSPVAGKPKFRVENNGNVILQGNVVAGEIYTLQIKVSDHGSPNMSTAVTVIVTITTRGNQPPQFTADNYTIYVSEGVPVSSSLWVIPTSDPERDPLTYFIVNSVPETNVFDISNLAGNPILRNIQLLDRERIATYTLIMRVQDNALNNDTATVTVIVTDVNDKAPVFSPSSYNFSLQENQASGTSVGTVTATDGDAPNTQFSSITHSLQQPNPDFSIDPRTGIITSNRPFDYETQKVYMFIVLASDGGMDPLVAVCRVTVNLLDLPDNVPVFDKPSYTFYVEEQMIANTTVGTVTATDLDSPPVVQYQFADSASSDFTINPVTGLIQTKIPLDYNIKSVYTFPVTTKDGSSSNIGLSTATVTVIVQDVNNFSPVISAGPATVTILETVNLGYVIVDVNATDNDPPNTDNSRITFSIRSVTPSAGEPFFFMNGNSGLVSVAAPLTSAGSDQYTVIVRAQDNGKSARSAEATITITILRNHPPVFSNPNITLSTVNASQTTVPYIVSAIDTDIPSEFQIDKYTLIGDSIALNFFSVAPNGVISIIRPLSSDLTINTFSLEVMVTDRSGLSARQTIFIPVNRNLADPVLIDPGSYQRTILETYDLGVTILTIRGSDSDPGIWGQLDFSIVNDGFDTVTYFDILDDGNIYLKRSLVNSGRNQYQFFIELRDRGVPLSRLAANHANVTITVVRNTQPPIFFTSIYNVTINETLPVGSSVVTVSANDADPDNSFNVVKYTLLQDLEGGQSDQFFILDVNNAGRINVNRSLTNTATDVFKVRVLASDNGLPPRTAYALVYIYIQRNFRAPTWPQNSYNTTIPEIQALGTNFLTIIANDLDSQPPNNQVICSLTGNAEALKYFQVTNLGNNNCGISVRVPLIYDTAKPNQYNLILKAQDQGSPPLESVALPVTVFVTRNQYPPVFRDDPYERVITLPVTNGQVLIQVTATDADPSPFNTVKYSVYPPAGQPNLFSIDSATGSITLNSASAFDGIQTVYTTYVQAEDNGNPSLYDLAVARFIIDRNRNGPQFTNTSITIYINEDTAPGSVIGSCSATDADSMPANAWPETYRIVYSVTSTRGLVYFDINTATSEIFIKRDLAEDTSSLNGQYILILSARDDAQYPKSASTTCTVTINVSHNNNPPIFQSIPYTYSIDRTVLANSIISSQIRAIDSDAGYYGIVRYRIIEQTIPDLFVLNSTNGQLSISRDISTQANTVFYVMIEAYDTGIPPKSDLELVTVTVNQNLNAPDIITPGSTSNYQASVEILETQSVNVNFYSVVAQDNDIADPFRSIYYYLIPGQTKEENLFQINSNNGAVSLRTSVLAERLYTIRIGARDGGSPPRSATATVTLTVSVYYDTYVPQFMSVESYPKTIDENLGVGSLVTTVSASDADRVGTFERVSYSLIGDTPSSAFFRIDNNSGQIYLTNSLSSSQQDYFMIRVRASDNRPISPLANETVFRISVNKNLQTPQWMITTYEITIPSFQALGVVLINLTATYSDTADTISYRIVNEEIQRDDNVGPSHYFIIDFSTGSLFLIRSLIGTSINSFVLIVKACDSDKLERCSNATVNVHILRTEETTTPITSTPLITTTTSTPLITTTTTTPKVTTAAATPSPSCNTTGGARKLFTLTQSNFDLNSSSTSLLVIDSRLDLSSFGNSPSVKLALYPPDSFLQIQTTDNKTFSVYTTSVMPEVTKNYHFFLEAEVVSGNEIARDFAHITVNFKRLFPTSPPVIVSFVLDGMRKGGIIYDLSSVLGNVEGLGLTLRSNPDTNLYDISPNQTSIFCNRDVRLSEFRSNANSIAHQHVLTVSTSQGTVLTLYAVIVLNIYSKQIQEDSLPGTLVADFVSLSNDFSVSVVPSTQPFVLKSTNITLGQPLDYENANQRQFKFNVSLALKSNPLFQTEIEANVIVTDVNDAPPEFQKATYTFITWKGALANSTIGYVEVSDPDSLNGFTYQIDGSENSKYFEVLPANGLIVSKVDLKSLSSLVMFNVSVKDGRNWSLRSTKVSISILQSQNDNLTEIGNWTVVSVQEQIPVHSFVTNASMANFIGYQLLPDFSAYVAINSSTGIITTTAVLDREDPRMPQIVFSVLAYHKDNLCNFQAISKITIEIIDINDNAPVFTMDGNYSTTLQENSNSGTTVFKVIASDKDKGENAAILFSLGSGQSSAPFSINNQTGVITVYNSSLLDREKSDIFRVVVIAVDGGTTLPSNNRSSATATLTINIIDVNDNSPVFTQTQYTFNISENQIPRVFVGNVAATDKDIGLNGEIWYFYQGSDSFAINRTSGLIQTTRPLDRELNRNYNLTVYAYDNGSPRGEGSCTVTIIVNDVNDNAPKFKQPSYTVNISEAYNCFQSAITNVSADDPDDGLNGQVFYTIANGSLSINSNTGVIMCKTPGLDYENPSERVISVQVTATDRGNPPLSASVTVRVRLTDVNDNSPEFIEQPPYNVTLPKETFQFSNTTVYVVSARDRDSNENGIVFYTLTAGSTGFEDLIWVDTSGVVRVNKTQTFNQDNSYTYFLVASDRGQPPKTNTTSLTLNVVNLDSSIRFNKSDFIIIIEEGKAPNLTTPVGILNILNSNLASQATFTLANNTVLNVNASSGHLYCISKLDREQQATYEILATVKDRTESITYGYAMVYVIVSDVNDNYPEFDLSEKQMVTDIEENSSNERFIIAITANDADAGNNSILTYFLLDPNIPFAVGASDGRLVVNGTLDRETNAHYTVVIMVKDNGSPSLSSNATVNVTILDVNDNAPTFNTLEISPIPEDADYLTWSAVVKATDPDYAMNGRVKYTVKNMEACPFSVNEDGVLTLERTKKLDFETNRSHTCIIQASDSPETGALSTTTTVIINVTDVNDNSPVFHDVIGRLNVSRDVGIPYVIVENLNVTDADSGINAEIWFDIDASTFAFDLKSYFGINAVSGNITVQKPLLDFPLESFNLTIVAYDKGEPALSNKLQIEVIISDENTPPKFSQKVYSKNIIEEDYTFLLQPLLIATAYDSENQTLLNTCNCTYFILDAKAETRLDVSDYFSINSSTGIISLTQRNVLIDRENTGNYIIVSLKVTDKGMPPKSDFATLNVTVLDINDNPPLFNPKLAEVTITKSKCKSGQVIYQARALDADIYPNNVIGYSLIPFQSPPFTRININETTGELVLIDPNCSNDTIDGTQFLVFISASDNKDNSTLTVHITVNLSDSNPNGPVFLQPLYQTSVSSTADIGTTLSIDNFRANDADGDGVTYAFEKHNLTCADDVFWINSATGKISLHSKLDQFSLKAINLTITATDYGNFSSRFSKTGTTTVYVTVSEYTEKVCIATDKADELQSKANQFNVFRGLFIAIVLLWAITIVVSVALFYKWRVVRYNLRAKQSDAHTFDFPPLDNDAGKGSKGKADTTGLPPELPRREGSHGISSGDSGFRNPAFSIDQDKDGYLTPSEHGTSTGQFSSADSILSNLSLGSSRDTYAGGAAYMPLLPEGKTTFSQPTYLTPSSVIRGKADDPKGTYLHAVPEEQGPEKSTYLHATVKPDDIQPYF